VDPAAHPRGGFATSKRLQAWFGMLWLVLGLACLLFVAVYSAAAGVRATPKPPADLWSEYPLDPTARDGSSSAPRATGREPTAPQDGERPAPAEPTAEASERSSSLRLALIAGFALAVLLAAISALSVLLPARPKRAAGRVPEPKVPAPADKQGSPRVRAVAKAGASGDVACGASAARRSRPML
jgi:hypothetical protein